MPTWPALSESAAAVSVSDPVADRERCTHRSKARHYLKTNLKANSLVPWKEGNVFSIQATRNFCGKSALTQGGMEGGGRGLRGFPSTSPFQLPIPASRRNPLSPPRPASPRPVSSPPRKHMQGSDGSGRARISFRTGPAWVRKSRHIRVKRQFISKRPFWLDTQTYEVARKTDGHVDVSDSAFLSSGTHAAAAWRAVRLAGCRRPTRTLANPGPALRSERDGATRRPHHRQSMHFTRRALITLN